MKTVTLGALYSVFLLNRDYNFLIFVFFFFTRLFPVIEADLSDSGTVDNVLELLVMAGGRTLPEVTSYIHRPRPHVYVVDCGLAHLPHVSGNNGLEIFSLRASSPIWASEASLARTRERAAKPRGAEEK